MWTIYKLVDKTNFGFKINKLFGHLKFKLWKFNLTFVLLNSTSLMRSFHTQNKTYSTTLNQTNSTHLYYLISNPKSSAIYFYLKSENSFENFHN